MSGRLHIKPLNRSLGLGSLSLLIGLTTLLLWIPLGVASPEPEQRLTVVRATLENGLRVLIVSDVLTPVVTTVTNYQVGSNEALAGFPGMAHAQEHMLFRGSPGLSADRPRTCSGCTSGPGCENPQRGVAGGPPGTGKTLLARTVAGEAKEPSPPTRVA
jgi:ATPase family associated with various cellular activities (AAA)